VRLAEYPEHVHDEEADPRWAVLAALLPTQTDDARPGTTPGPDKE
jgi:hypothetical protein